MQRRTFLFAGASAALLSRLAQAAELADDLRVTRVVGFDVPSQRSKIAGKNSRLDVHGDRATDRMVRIYTNRGIEGIGNCRMNRDEAAKLPGNNPLEFYDEQQRRVTGPFGTGTMPLWDLLGKLLDKPVYQLLGGAGPERVPVYDGSIYFADLLPQYASDWQDRFRREVDMAMEIGHRALKIKIGRGAKWMPRHQGDRRDCEVVRVIRQHAGTDGILGVDANNGYDLDGTLKFFDQVGDQRIAFAEEMFPEKVADCLRLKAYLRRKGWQTLVADGETQRDLEVFRPFMQAKAIDVYQADMNRFGFEGILQEAEWARRHGLRVAPHNWGSLVGFYMQLHVGRAIDNFYRAEHDPLKNKVLIADGYAISQGQATVPERPGFGIEIHDEQFAKAAKIRYDLRA